MGKYRAKLTKNLGIEFAVSGICKPVSYQKIGSIMQTSMKIRKFTKTISFRGLSFDYDLNQLEIPWNHGKRVIFP